MLKNVLFIAFMASLVYGAYLLNVKYFSDPATASEEKTPRPGDKSSESQNLLATAEQASSVGAPASAPTGQPAAGAPNLFICLKVVTAYSKSTPHTAIGYFQRGTPLEVGDPFPDSGMVNVTFRDPKGQTIFALCKPEDVGLAQDSASSKPLEKPTLSIGRTLGDHKSLLDSQKNMGSPPPGNTYSGIKQKAKNAGQ